MARNASPARLVIALSVAAVLAVFLLYTSIAGAAIPPSRRASSPVEPVSCSWPGSSSAR